MAKVTVIPSTINPLTQMELNSTEKRKVAAYARVSTDSDEQYTSYEMQVKTYRNYIQERVDWEYVNVYADEGISGTNTKRRVQFNKMIEDALEGKIDLIITKSISRFARNTLDTITYIRKLKSAGVEVFFEKENLWTFDSKSEMFLSMLAAMAQEESRSISENVKMGIRWGMKEGKVKMPFKCFLGYEKVDGKISIVEEEVKIVRRIYSMFLRDGMTRKTIADTLKREGILTPSKKNCDWTVGNIQSILTNEKYKGDAILQKVFIEDYLDHKKKVNTGQLPKYFVENSHPAIINKDEWNLVQIEIEKREKFKYAYSSNNPYFSKLICEDCGRFYGVKIWHSNSKYRKKVLQCNFKYYNNKDKCKTPNLTEEEVNAKFVQVYNEIMVNKDSLIKETKEIIDFLTNTEELDEKIKELDEELNNNKNLVENLIKQNKIRIQSQDNYLVQYNLLVNTNKELRSKRDILIKNKEEKIYKSQNINSFLAEISDKPNIISEFDSNLWNIVLDEAIVHKNKTITFKFRNGKEITK